MVVNLFCFGKTEIFSHNGIKETCEGLSVMPFPSPVLYYSVRCNISFFL